MKRIVLGTLVWVACMVAAVLALGAVELDPSVKGVVGVVLGFLITQPYALFLLASYRDHQFETGRFSP